MKSRIFSPISLGNLTINNRIVVAPMCQYSAIEGSATDWHLMHLGQLSISGSALVFIEATAVEEKVNDDATGSEEKPKKASSGPSEEKEETEAEKDSNSTDSNFRFYTKIKT